jgi:small subunit ribosomal protein S14
MAKLSSVLKNNKRKEMATKFRAKRDALRSTIKNPETTPEDRIAAVRKLSTMPKNSNINRVVLRCAVSGRPRGNLRKFGLSRMQFRDKALAGELTGVVKASW